MPHSQIDEVYDLYQQLPREKQEELRRRIFPRLRDPMFADDAVYDGPAPHDGSAHPDRYLTDNPHD